MAEQSVKKRLREWIKSDDIDILRVPPKIFQPHRILILKILYLHGEAEFRELKHDLQITDGNLASHLRALEEEGYVKVHKHIIDRKLRTAYVLTKEGSDAFMEFKMHLAKVIRNELEG